LKITYSIIENVEDWSNYKADWQGLHENAQYSSIYNSFEFIYQSVRHYHSPVSRDILVKIHSDGQLIGLFFLNECKQYRLGIPLRTMEFCGLEEGDKIHPLIHQSFPSQAWKGFFAFLKEHKARWDIISLNEQTDDQISRMLVQLKRRHFWFRCTEDKSGPLIPLSTDWQSFKAQHKKLRQRLKRFEQHFNGRYRFEMRPGNQLLDDYLTVESNSWKFKKLGIQKSHASENFHSQLMMSLDDKKSAIGILYVDDQPISGEIIYSHKKTVYLSQGCYDQNLAKFSPGMISTTYLLQNLIESGKYQWADGLCGYAGYLHHWAEKIVTTKKIEILNVNLPILGFLAVKVIDRIVRAPLLKLRKSTNEKYLPFR